MKYAMLLVALSGAGSAFAQTIPGEFDEIGDGGPNQASSEGIQPYLEYKKRIETAQNISPLDNGMFGESTSLYNGSTSFTVVDIDLPGNNALPVRLARTIAVDIQPVSMGPAYDTLLRGLGNWQVDVPYLAAVYPQSTGWSSSRCSMGSVPPLTMAAGFYARAEYWQGISVNVPGRGATSALGVIAAAPKPTTGVNYRLTTTERDYFDCIPMKSGLAGEGFRMTATDGTKYYFDVGTLRTASQLEKRYMRETVLGGFAEVPVYLPRNKYYLLASKIEDAFGNTVNIQYNTAGHPTRIWSSDGREIQLTYSSGRLATAAADGRVWQYQYTANANGDPNPDLTAVVLPDGSRWKYAYAGNLKPSAPPSWEDLYLPWCGTLQSGVVQDFTLQATHPSGALGEFNFRNDRHYRSGVHATECMRGGDPAEPTYTLLTPYYFDVMSLQSKSISGPGMATRTWTYDYGVAPEFLWGTPDQAPVYPCATCAPEKVVVVTQPDGSKQRLRFGKMYRFNEGRTLGTDVLAPNGTVLRAETNVYLSEAEAPGQLFHGLYGTVLGGIADPMTAYVRPVVSRTTTQQARNFTWRVDRTCGTHGTAYCFDSLARPTKVVRASAQP